MAKLKQYRVYGTVTGSKYLGIYKAKSKDEAEEMALNVSFASFCHQCCSECEDPEVTSCEAEEIQKDDPDYKK